MLSTKVKELLERIGEGVINAVPYDTAIVAWIPRSTHLFPGQVTIGPEFPECVDWLRRHQLPDGSWGTDRATLPYANIVSTLAAIIAIAKWSDSDADTEAVRRGEVALNVLVGQISAEDYEPIGYEIILPMLLTEAKCLGLKIPYKLLKNESLFEEKFVSIRSHQKKYGWTRKHSFWYSLEMVFGLTEPEDIQMFTPTTQVLEDNGSVCGSPSASAFYLMKTGIETKTYQYLRQLVTNNSGGMPALSPSDTFELSWSLSALLMSGFPREHPCLKTPVEKLWSKWKQFNGYVGCSSCLPPDIDAIASFVYVLNSYQMCDESDCLAKMLKFFNNNYFICFEDERNASISVNITALIALKTFSSDQRIYGIITKVLDWLKSRINGQELMFDDKWHVSPFYTISRAVFAFQGIDDQLMDRCVRQLLSHQNADNGWGICGSTLEETALVTLALCHWLRTNPDQLNEKNIKIMQSVDKFFKTFNGEPYVELWIAKSLYCPKLVIDMFVVSAQHSLKQLELSSQLITKFNSDYSLTH